MKPSTAKDIVLRYHVSGKCKQAYDRLQYWEKQDALIDLEKENYLKTIETSGIGSGNARVYLFETFQPKAKAFVETGKSFRRQAIWQWVIDFPKNYWAVLLLISLVVSKINFEKSEIKTRSIELNLQPDLKLDTIILIYKKRK